MTALDCVELGVADVDRAREFYASVFAPSKDGDGASERLGLHGTGRIGIEAVAPSGSGAATVVAFDGLVLSYVLRQPSEVESVTDAAVAAGAELLKPPKKGFFGGFGAVLRAPGGTIWKLAAPSRKDTGPAADPPRPTETVALLAVSSPKASKAFYAALGMDVDRDYGDKYIDFRSPEGACRLALMQRGALAKDAGVSPAGDGYGAITLTHQSASRDAVDDLLRMAEAAGGRIVGAATETDAGAYEGRFADPDGVPWRVSAA